MAAVEGVVEHGDARGRTLGFPAANLALTVRGVEDGVWAGWVRTGAGASFVAAVSVGRRRTFYTGEGPRLLEAHLLDFTGDLYGQLIRVELVIKVRDQQRFSSIGDLVAQMHRDVEDIRAWGAMHPRGTLSCAPHPTMARALV